MPEYFSVMNNTKWNELRLAMCGLDPSPSFRCKSTNGHYSAADSEWYYHFKSEGYGDIEYVDIFASDLEQRAKVEKILKTIHVAGFINLEGFRIYGKAIDGQHIDYI